MAGPNKRFSSDRVLDRAKRRAGITVEPVSDYADLVALTRLTLPEGDISDPAYYRWQYENNPAGRAYAVNGRRDGTLAGHYAVIPLRFQIGGKLLLGSLSVNTMTHPRHQGKGVFMLLAEKVFQECRNSGNKFTLGFPNPSSHKGFLNHLNFAELGRLPLWVAPFWRLWLACVARRSKEGLFKIQETPAIDDSFDEFWDQVGKDYSNLVVRNRAYLQWRFIQHPSRTYRILTAAHQDRLLGYLVARVTKVRGIRCGMIVDMLVERTAEGTAAAKELIEASMRLFARERVILAGCLMKDPTVMSVLQKSGFLRCPKLLLPREFPVILRWHDAGTRVDGISDWNRWYLTMGDYDVM